MREADCVVSSTIINWQYLVWLNNDTIEQLNTNLSGYNNYITATLLSYIREMATLIQRTTLA